MPTSWTRSASHQRTWPGLSFGGALALELYRRHPAIQRTLVLALALEAGHLARAGPGLPARSVRAVHGNATWATFACTIKTPRTLPTNTALRITARESGLGDAFFDAPGAGNPTTVTFKKEPGPHSHQPHSGTSGVC